MALEDRLVLDAMVMAADLAEIALQRLESALLEILEPGTKPPVLSPQKSAELAMYAWTIVDNVHNFRCFAQKLQMTPGGVLAKFVDSSKVATVMRNSMDHRPANLGNTASRTKVDPIYGVLSFLSPIGTDGAWNWHQVAFGGLHHPQHSFPIIDTWLRPAAGRITHLHMGAFDETINLSVTLEGLLDAQRFLNAKVEENVVSTVRQDALDNASDPAATLSDISGGQAWIVIALGKRG